MQLTTIIHEGCTEEIYLKHLLSLNKIYNTSVLDFHNVDGGGPVDLLNKFNVLKSNSERNHINNYLFIMDSDRPEHDAIKTEILSHKHKYSSFEVISFDPCIEMFLIAHFESNIHILQDKAKNKELSDEAILIATGTKAKNIGSPCKQSERHLKYHHIPGYKKATCNNKFKLYINQEEVKRAYTQCQSLKDLINFIKAIK